MEARWHGWGMKKAAWRDETLLFFGTRSTPFTVSQGKRQAMYISKRLDKLSWLGKKRKNQHPRDSLPLFGLEVKKISYKLFHIFGCKLFHMFGCKVNNYYMHTNI